MNVAFALMSASSAALAMAAASASCMPSNNSRNSDIQCQHALLGQQSYFSYKLDQLHNRCAGGIL
jgi:hypothetical protein